MQLRNLCAALVAGITLAACAMAGSTVPSASTASSSQTPLSSVVPEAVAPYAFAPYVDMTAYPAFAFAAGSASTGTKYYTMAFVVSYQNKCEGAWAGEFLPSDKTIGSYVRKQLANIRKVGGDGIVSFGGAGGTELADVCTGPASLAAAYEAIVDAYRVTHIDFDIEGNNPYDTASFDRRSQALALLEAHYKAVGTTMTVSYTLPILPKGMPDHVVDVLKSALRFHTGVDIVNVMTMDFGDANAPNPQGHMGTYSIEAVQNAARQLKRIGWPLGANPYASIGVTPMIGVNDTAGEIFEPSDAQALLAWAKSNGIGRIAFWAAQRDKQCKGGTNPHASDTCSGILQKPGQFQKIFAAY
jgi:Glycosyl hydrolases family 18